MFLIKKQLKGVFVEFNQCLRLKTTRLYGFVVVESF